MMAAQVETPPSKKARRNKNSWKEFRVESVNHDGKVFGLRDVFGHGFSKSMEDISNSGSPSAGITEATSSIATMRSTTANVNKSGQSVNNNFYTLRMEHREGGPLAKHRGEERILLFTNG